MPGAASPPTAPAPRQADPEALAHALEQGRVETETAAPEALDYLGSLWGRLVDVVRAALEQSGLDLAGVPALGGGILITAAVLALLAAAAVVAWRMWKGRLRRRESLKNSEAAEAGRRGEKEVDRPAWRREIESRLARGEVLAALEALWWWAGLGLVPQGPDPAWTSGQLARRAGRRDLLPEMGRLDRLRFGPEVPAAGDVRTLCIRLEDSLP